MQDRISLDGRVAVVTGAGRGLGRTHAIHLARRGAKVVVNDAGEARGGGPEAGLPADDVVAEIEGAGGVAVADRNTVADAEAAEDIVARALSEFDRLDIVVTNAGINRLASFEDVTPRDFADILAVHLFGTFNVIRAAYPAMRAAGYGRIVMTASQIAWKGKDDSPAYGAAKGGILGLMETLKLTAPAHGILVNAIAPLALTRAGEGVFPEPLRPFLGTGQVSELVAFLASEACSLNGEVLIAGACHVAVAETRESVGIDFDNPDNISAEILAARMPEILNSEGAIHYRDAMDAVGVAFERLKCLA